MSAEKNTKVVADLSDTQRLVLLDVFVHGEGRVELRKEWRRSQSDEWSASKGITVPKIFVPALIEALNAFSGKQ